MFRFLDRFHLSSLSLLSEGVVSILDKDPDHCLQSRDHLLSVVEAVTSSKDPLAALQFQPSPAARTSVHVTLFGRLSGYSTIALISHASKILLKIIMKRLKRKLDEEINQTQAGFRQNRGTRDQIFNLRMLIEKCREANINLHMCFIDHSKAFNCVRHREMIEALKQMNCHYKITNLIINLYQEQLAAVRLESGLTDWFPVKRGAQQGCILSPPIFNMYTETIMRKVEADGELTSFNAVKMHGKEVKELRYADDTVLFAQKPEGLRRLLQSVKMHSESSGLYLNAKKTKIMDLDKSPTTTIDVDGEQLENVNNFVYLGSRIDADGKSSPDFRCRIAIAVSKLNTMAPLWKSQSTELKWRTLKACIFPVAIYGCEAWTISKTDEKKITSFEMKCYRKILRISWTERKTNASVLEQLGVKAPLLLNLIKKQKLSYFGHIERHNTLEKLFLEGTCEGRRGRGRPRRRWTQDIGEWMGVSTVEAGRQALERGEFRQTVWEATSIKDPP